MCVQNGISYFANKHCLCYYSLLGVPNIELETFDI